jgi:hypothetical protein
MELEISMKFNQYKYEVYAKENFLSFFWNIETFKDSAIERIELM